MHSVEGPLFELFASPLWVCAVQRRRFPVGARPTRQPLQPEASGAVIEAYGVQRWLGELALALRKESYRADPIRRVFIPKANGKLRPLGISTLRDRVCMTAAMLVLEPIFRPAKQTITRRLRRRS
jgi:hypothetical protein